MAVAPLKKGKQLGDVGHFVCVSIALFRCEAESGSKLLLGVRSEPKNDFLSCCLSVEAKSIALFHRFQTGDSMTQKINQNE